MGCVGLGFFSSEYGQVATLVYIILNIRVS